MREFFARGAEVLARPVIDCCEPDGITPFVVIQYVRGISLAAIVRRCGALPLLRSSNIACQILAALDTTRAGAIASDNVVVEPHRDGSETVKIDLGPARRTPVTASEIYAVAVLLYEMITGVTPLRGGIAVRPSQLRPDRFIPHELERVVMTALDTNPAVRFSSAAAFAAAIVAATPTTESSSWFRRGAWSSTASTETTPCAA
jgi:serine/threonine protein kinase